MTAVLTIVAVLLLLWLSLLFVPFRWRPLGLYLIIPKALAVAFVPVIAALGVVLAVVGALLGSWLPVALAGLVTAGALVVMVRVGAVRPDLTAALGADWPDRVPAELRRRMVSPWWRGRLPRRPEPQLDQDVPYATVPGTDRVLRCDVWRPSEQVRPSGLTLVYLFGGAYYALDKDLGTRPLFRHLAAQGHVVVDVAYRLFPDTDVPGMVADAKRAVAWVRAHADELGVDPDHIVLAGGSAGGHLALLAAYAHDDPVLTPVELRGSDPRVRAVVSLYGQVRLDALYDHSSQDRTCHPDDPQPDWTAPPGKALVRIFGDDAARLRLQFMMYGGRCDWLVGGTPDEVADRYAQLSALGLVRPDCPPTLLLHGTHDEMAPVSAVRQLAARLREAGVPVAAAYLPHTDHMFDLVATRWSPAARVGISVLERFLAVVSTTGPQIEAFESPRAGDA